MKDEIAESIIEETETTGLPWLRTWKSTYLFVSATFLLWVGLLISLTESFK